MAADVPTIEPREITSGNTASWTKALADYPYDEGWRLTYYIVGAGSLTVSTTADDDGKGYAATITVTQSTALQAGDYWIEGKVTYSGETYTVYASSLKVLPNFATLTTGHDGRSSVRKIRDGLRQMVEGTASHPEIAFQLFGDRSWQLVPLKERLDALARYEGLVAEEEKAERLARGERNGVFIRFVSPR